jgi:hypothetical protein
LFSSAMIAKSLVIPYFVPRQNVVSIA